MSLRNGWPRSFPTQLTNSLLSHEDSRLAITPKGSEVLLPQELKKNKKKKESYEFIALDTQLGLYERQRLLISVQSVIDALKLKQHRQPCAYLSCPNSIFVRIDDLSSHADRHKLCPDHRILPPSTDGVNQCCFLDPEKDRRCESRIKQVDGLCMLHHTGINPKRLTRRRFYYLFTLGNIFSATYTNLIDGYGGYMLVAVIAIMFNSSEQISSYDAQGAINALLGFSQHLLVVIGLTLTLYLLQGSEWSVFQFGNQEQRLSRTRFNWLERWGYMCDKHRVNYSNAYYSDEEDPDLDYLNFSVINPKGTKNRCCRRYWNRSVYLT